MTQYRLIVLLAWMAIVPIGFASKIYRGPFQRWVNDSTGGILYEMFWILLIVLVRPKTSPAKAALWVFAITACLECLQLWHPPFLEAIRATFIGRTLLGTTFDGWDFLYYLFGCTFTWLGLHKLKAAMQSISD
ncbi:MAG: DUF2809 domain-containing protein [Actinomycetota bacterium]